MRRFISWCSIHTDAGSGSYAVIDDTLTVRCANGTKSVQLGDIPPASWRRHCCANYQLSGQKTPPNQRN